MPAGAKTVSVMGKYFSIVELTASGEARRRGIDNTPPPEVKVKLNTLITRLLDPIRELWGGPITVTSGFRCPVLNKAVKGVPSSQHVKGEAADITVGSPDKNRKLFELILSSGLEFDQLIDERNYSWIHVSYSVKNRKQVLHL